MTRTVRLALLSLTVFLVLFTVSVGKPGLPSTLKADEPAYFLMALSLARDGDLRCELQDLHRLFDTYPHLPAENLILMSDDGWETIYFGKPFVYSLLSAPLTVLFGANGLVALNALLFALMIWGGALYLSRFNDPTLAALFSLAFFFLSPAFVYVFWLQPEILSMASAMGCLFLAFHPLAEGPAASARRNRVVAILFNARTAPWWSGAALSFAIYNKPVFALMGIPALYIFWRKRGLRAALAWVLAVALAVAALAGLSVLFTGHPTPYLGVARGGMKVEQAETIDGALERLSELKARESETINSWSWIFRLPSMGIRELLENLGYFFWGRHTGILLYLPFAVLSFLLFLLQRRHSLEHWLCLAALASVALFFLLFIPFNWHGGGGFVGNRYFIAAYPGFLFLVTRIRPRWTPLVGSAWAGLFLGPLLFSPFGAPVREPTLQAHVRGWPYRFFPLELSIRTTIPGYRYASFPKLQFIGRRDVFRIGSGESGFWLQGATSSDLLLITDRSLTGVFFEVTTRAPDNEIRLSMAGVEERLTFSDAQSRRERSRLVELRPQRVSRYHYKDGKRLLVYRLSIHPRTGTRLVGGKNRPADFYLGAQLRYLGRRDQVTQPEHYRIRWLSVGEPPPVTAAEPFELPVRVRNLSTSVLSSLHPLAVNLSYHWVDSNGQSVVFGGLRTPLGRDLAPKKIADIVMRVEPPDKPGSYHLVLDAVREHVSWFSQRDGETREIPIEVRARPSPQPSTMTPETPDPDE
jgi:hypothetical protein